MTTTLTLDSSGRLFLPPPILSLFGMQPGAELTVEVSPGRIELLKGNLDDVPVVTELSPDGRLKLPCLAAAPSAEQIVAAIQADREARVTKLSGQ